MLVVAASFGKVVLAVLLCAFAAGLFVLRWNDINRRSERRAQERAERKRRQ